MSEREPIVSQLNRHLKWKSFDNIELVLMWLCGFCIAGFTAGVFFDVLTRTIGHPWLWLQEVTLGFFTYGIFLGAAVATRRNQHVTLASIAENLKGKQRTFFEVLSRLITIIVCLCIIYFGYLNFLLGFGIFLMPSMTPIATLYAAIPISGLFIALFTIEQLVNGLKNGFEITSFYSDDETPSISFNSERKEVTL